MKTKRKPKKILVVSGDSGRETFVKGDLKRTQIGVEIKSGLHFAVEIFKHLLDDLFEIRDLATAKETVVPHTWQLTGRRRNDHVALRLTDAPSLKSEASNEAWNVDAKICEADRKADFLYLHDSGGRWRSMSETSQLYKYIQETLARFNATEDPPKVIVNLGNALPKVTTKGGRLMFVDPIWQLLEKYGKSICVICSCTPLRREGAAISRRLSWEQTIEDFATDMILFEPLRIFSRFQNFIVRFGHAGASHVQTMGGRRAASLVFAPMAKDGIFRDPFEDGKIIGKNVVLSAGIFREFFKSRLIPKDIDPALADRMRQDQTRESIAIGLRRGIIGCMSIFREGYPDPSRYQGHQGAAKYVGAFVAHSASKFKEDHISQAPADPDTVCSIAVPCSILSRPPGSLTNPRSSWEILRDQITCCQSTDQTIIAESLEDQVSRINVGIAIVKYGASYVLNREFKENLTEKDNEILRILRCPECIASREEPRDHITLAPHTLPSLPEPSIGSLSTRPFKERAICAPSADFSELRTMERSDIEGIRSIRNLVKRYLERHGADRNEKDKPISIAVFGPPGTGKSFAVKQVINSINQGQQDGSIKLKIIEVNMSQCRSVDDLGRLFEFIGKASSKREMPVIFFDEFDCEFEHNSLGWLKYFLAPMQDGVFHTLTGDVNVGGSIFIFAGGVSSRFSDFDPSEPPGLDRYPTDTGEHRERNTQFKSRKGPDFVSRLQGHLNILGIDGPEGHTKPIVRRALILRALLIQHGYTNLKKGEEKKTSMVDNCVAHVDEDILYTMLTVDRYRHGVRSMEAILRMCTPVGGRLLKASLPSRIQLNMHVDADEFFIRMYRARARRQPDLSPDASSHKPSRKKRSKRAKLIIASSKKSKSGTHSIRTPKTAQGVGTKSHIGKSKRSGVAQP